MVWNFTAFYLNAIVYCIVYCFKRDNPEISGRSEGRAMPGGASLNVCPRRAADSQIAILRVAGLVHSSRPRNRCGTLLGAASIQGSRRCLSGPAPPGTVVLPLATALPRAAR